MGLICALILALQPLSSIADGNIVFEGVSEVTEIIQTEAELTEHQLHSVNELTEYPPPISDELAEEPPLLVPEPMHIVDTTGKYPLSKIESDLILLTEHYGDITELITIGYSYEERPIYAVKIGLPSEVIKPNVLLISNIHAREKYTSMLTMKMLDYILYSYYDSGFWDGYDISSILSKLDIYIVPVLNPDGVIIAESGIKSSKNYEYLKTIKDIAGDNRWWKANARGVDLNGNFDDGNWKIKWTSTSSKYPASEGYKGSAPNSEPETNAIQKFTLDILPLMSISYHSSGEIMYWADTDTHKYFKGIDTKVVNSMAKLTTYRPEPVTSNAAVFGAGYENWFKKELQRFCICMEVSPYPGKRFIQHPPERFDELVWKKAKYTGVQLAIEALKYSGEYYDVYQNERFLKTFYEQGEAVAYAKRWAHSRVIRNNETIWEFDKVVIVN